MAFGRGSGNAACLVLVALAVLACVEEGTEAATYTVGDANGTWTIPVNNGLDYTTWAASHTFNFGDEIVFNYNNNTHNVTLVTATAYSACDITVPPIASWDSGDDVIELTRNIPEYYFMCGAPGHCALGQKFQISVPMLAAAPTVPTTPNTPTVTSPPPPSGSSGLPAPILRCGVLLSSLAMVLCASLIII